MAGWGKGGFPAAPTALEATNVPGRSERRPQKRLASIRTALSIINRAPRKIAFTVRFSPLVRGSCGRWGQTAARGGDRSFGRVTEGGGGRGVGPQLDPAEPTRGSSWCVAGSLLHNESFAFPDATMFEIVTTEKRPHCQVSGRSPAFRTGGMPAGKTPENHAHCQVFGVLVCGSGTSWGWPA